MNYLKLLALSAVFLCASCHNGEQLPKGDYCISGMSFQDNVSQEVMNDFLSHYGKITVKEDSIICSDSDKFEYYYEKGYLHVITQNGKKIYECEDFSTSQRNEYLIVINDDIVKKIRYSSAK